jgi:predicted HicB family RNase H-like nuclease
MPVSEAQKRATEEYERKTYVHVRTRVRHDDANLLYSHTLNRNESVNGFINRAVREQIKRDAINADASRQP